jgi:hypothetical protein
MGGSVVKNVSAHPIIYIANVCEELTMLAAKLGQKDLARVLEMAEIEARYVGVEPQRIEAKPAEKAAAKRRRKYTDRGVEIRV